MHPHLADEKVVHCGELIKQLKECHAKGFMYKLTGRCNGIKHDLNMCLRQERIKRTERNREDSKIRNERKKEVWKALEDDR